MGELKNNNMMESASGKVGVVVFRRVRGLQLVTNRPPRGRKAASAKQQDVVDRFTSATRYAEAALKNGDLTAKYTAKVGGKLYTPRLVAISDYLNAPKIKNIDTSLYKGVIGNVITVRATDDFLVTRVHVNVLSAGVSVESGEAVEDPIRMLWLYTATAAAAPGSITLQISAYDTAGNVTTQAQTV